jgi:phage shock protein A
MEQVESGAFDGASGASTENSNDIQEPVKPAASASSKDHERYKRDMIRYKDQVADLTEKLKQFELADQEQKGNLQKVIDKLKTENKELKTKYSQDRYQYAVSKIEDSVKLTAQRLGCKDPDTFYRLIDSEEIKGIEVDERFNASKKDIEEVVTKAMKKYEHLGFFEKKVNVVDRAPSAVNDTKTKPLDKMDVSEILEMGKKLGLKTL